MTPAPVETPAAGPPARRGPARRGPAQRGPAQQGPWETLAWLVVAAGILARAAYLWSAPPLLIDEAALANNILGRSFAGLVVSRLDNLQVAPVGFLWTAKAATLAFGEDETALRLVPFLCGAAALALLPGLARAFAGGAGAGAGTLLATCALAFAPLAIEYACTVKPYAGDVLACVLLLRLAVRPAHPLLMASAGTLAVLLSFPAALVAAAAALCVLADRARASDWRGFWIGCGISFIWYCGVTTTRLLAEPSITAEGVRGYWEGAFVPFPPRNPSHARILWNYFEGTFRDPLGFTLPGIGTFLALCGATAMAALREDRRRLALLMMPVLAFCLVNGAGVYPLSFRTTHFLLPVFTLAFARGAVVLGTAWRPDTRAGLLAGSILLISPAVRAASIPPPRGELRPLVRDLADGIHPDDALYVSHSAWSAFTYYARRHGVAGSIATRGGRHRADLDAYRREFAALEGRARVWFLHTDSHATGDIDAPFLPCLEGRPRREVHRAPGAVLYLYDLTGEAGRE